jgi:O-acetyl-ADP-ribose deacetylase (regulator of RNase III)
MKTYDEVDGDLIKLALAGEFDVIAHGCNCFSTMGAGIAPQMAKAFGCDLYEMEKETHFPLNKLGCIDYQVWWLDPDSELIVVNAYTQYSYGRNHSDGVAKPVDYHAILMCFKKMNEAFCGMHIGLPWIGCGLAGGERKIVKYLIKKYLKDCHVTVVNYKP